MWQRLGGIGLKTVVSKLEMMHVAKLYKIISKLFYTTYMRCKDMRETDLLLP